MDTDLVRRAQGGDQEAFANLAATIADRFLATSHRILSDIDRRPHPWVVSLGAPSQGHSHRGSSDHSFLGPARPGR
jgi:hypothetical protein